MDYPLIEASFATQYGIRLRKCKMSWNEFITLLNGLMPETPLGRIVSIRSETDRETLKNFTKEQMAIRRKWRQQEALQKDVDDIEKLQKMLKMTFS